MTPQTPTPSANMQIPMTQEHVDARQAAIDAGRYAYIATLTPEQQDKFAAIERAVKILEENKILFYLQTLPLGAESGLWEYSKFTYQSVDTEEGRREGNTSCLRIFWNTLVRFVKLRSCFISVFDMDRRFVGAWGPDGEIKPPEPQS